MKNHLQCHEKPKYIIDPKLTIAILIIILIIILDLVGIKSIHNLANLMKEYIRIIWLPLLIGILISGLIDRYVKREYIIRYLAKSGKKSLIYSILLGFLASACSHGILAISMELYRKGASTSSIIAFLLASPWANLGVTFLLFGFFGIKALFIIFSAIVIALITGIIYSTLENKGIVESNSNINIPDLEIEEHHHKTIIEKTKHDLIHILSSSWEIANMVLFWIVFGVILAAIIGTYVPKEIFEAYMGPNILGIFVTLILATILEVCSEGTAPLAFEIYRKTSAFGNAFVFLMAGVVTDYTEIGIIASNIGKRAAILLPIITVPQVLLLGYLFNVLL